ncbi:MAG: hypothetical protein M3436_17420 [Pseudomonadota bacterium]|nr:hypothetical protein [Pseudomonadota bacterium]
MQHQSSGHGQLNGSRRRQTKGESLRGEPGVSLDSVRDRDHGDPPFIKKVLENRIGMGNGRAAIHAAARQPRLIGRDRKNDAEQTGDNRHAEKDSDQAASGLVAYGIVPEHALCDRKARALGRRRSLYIRHRRNPKAICGVAIAGGYRTPHDQR